MNDRPWPRALSEAEWEPGLPPPLEALQQSFPSADGWQVHGRCLRHGRASSRLAAARPRRLATVFPFAARTRPRQWLDGRHKQRTHHRTRASSRSTDREPERAAREPLQPAFGRRFGNARSSRLSRAQHDPHARDRRKRSPRVERTAAEHPVAAASRLTASAPEAKRV